MGYSLKNIITQQLCILQNILVFLYSKQQNLTNNPTLQYLFISQQLSIILHHILLFITYLFMHYKILEGPQNFIRLPRQNHLNDFTVHQQTDQLLSVSHSSVFRFDFNKKIKISQQNFSGRLCQFWDTNYVYTWDNVIINGEDKIYSHLDTITQIECDENKLAVTSGNDYLLFISDLAKNQNLTKLEYHSAGITRFFWKNSLVVSGDQIGEIAFWDINKAKMVYSNNTLYNGYKIMTIEPYADYGKNNIFCFSATNNQNMMFLDMRTNKVVTRVKMGDAYISCVGINLSGFVIAGSSKNQIHIIDICSGFKKMAVFKTESSVNTLQSIDNLFFTGNQDGNIGLFNIDTNQNVYAFGLAQKGTITKLRLNPKKTKLIGMGSESMIYILQF